MSAVQLAEPPVTPETVERRLAERVRRFINSHAGDVHVLDVSPQGDVHLAFGGACAQCPHLSATFAVSVLPAVKSLPGVRSVSADGVTMSDAALRRVAALFAPSPTKGEPA